MKNKDKDPFAEPEEIIYVSRTEMKNDMLKLQELGENIVKLSNGQLATIPLDDPILAEAIHTARRIKHKEGLRRQMQYIGKLMRKTDTEAMSAAYQKLLDGRKEDAKAFHQLEQWRDQLIENGPNAVEEVMAKFPQAERQHLRQLVIQANKEKTNNKPPAAARKLFRYLRELADI
ncbi:ribosome biogenesis factor YjgA [Oceanicoccus sp. KOV_DT_Chl]|uniref:ribosome biogenesis factor YjgA n=1 Tax=Oceanicoccus sp. KOV_DT_Chl TaxID=1904639 RepID=UPI000C7A8216|nr:ribosome biogenesis factor YjgA [Oceanicoccus sp. KOV_DT_Chl]